MNQRELSKYREDVEKYSRDRLVSALVREAQLRDYYQNKYYQHCDLTTLDDFRSEKQLLTGALIDHGRTATEGLR